MNSDWDITRQRSQYHFDTTTMDPRWDTVLHLGNIQSNWNDELQNVIENSKPVTWRTRGKENDPLTRPDLDYDREEYDLERIGMGKDYIVTNLSYDIPTLFQNIADQFGLDNSMTRIHVQYPGQVWNLHLDKLEKWMPSDPTQVVRYFVQLTDWQQGQFWSYGNYMWSGWRAGDVSTFDWLNVPHSTANAGFKPRVTFQLTGVKTAKTEKFLETINHSYKV